MKILMVTNTYKPFTGGVPRSVDTFAEQYRKMGHVVKIVAPDFEGQEADPDVFRLPALQHFNGTDFSVHLPVSDTLWEFANSFCPDILHSHHPFLLGNTALRLAARLERPLVFTHHTFYERYLHYLPGGDSEPLRKFVISLAAGYANLTNQVIAPSESVAEDLRRRGVVKPVEVLPTGVDTAAIAAGDGARYRQSAAIPPDAFLVGFVSRLAPEKNLEFLCDAVEDFMRREPRAWFALAGTGPSEDALKARFETSEVRDRIRMQGNLCGEDLHDFYRGLDVFAFASVTETQGLVVTEAMAASVPVVALRAPGVQDVVRDGVNGRLIENAEVAAFSQALQDVLEAWDNEPAQWEALQNGARQTAEALSDAVCARKALDLYATVIAASPHHAGDESSWETFGNRIVTEWNLLSNIGAAAGEALREALAPSRKSPEKEDPATLVSDPA